MKQKRGNNSQKGKQKNPNTGGISTQPHLQSSIDPTTSIQNASNRGSLVSRDVALPLPFSTQLPRPTDEFLRNEAPYKESFRAALTTAYEGFTVDATLDKPTESQVQASLEQMQQNRYFRPDVTQPFGLGTKCAKTYVTRCLVGAPGTTYKYLGLRMFAHPWKTTPGTSANTRHDVAENAGTGRIGELGQILSNRTQHHLKQLDATRAQREIPPTQYTHTQNEKLATFDICLINRMDASEENLKEEPTQKKMKTSVSWHADSSLENFSTIAVYQTLVPKDGTKREKAKENGSNGWYVALRVAHHSEGPHSSRRGTDIDSAIVKDTPPIAASLPSGSAYYLLDDFNHHHQHTVLSNGNTAAAKQSIRYSCTYRLLRNSHNIEDMLQRCRSAISQFHRKGPKLWRSEQLALTELESEWIRQFYIQGRDHYTMLTQAYWKEPLQQLLQYWSQFEQRTKQTLDLLRYAAEGKVGKGSSSAVGALKPSKVDRKAREKRKKALTAVQEILGRNELDCLPNDANALTYLYEPVAELLKERAVMRELWAKREKDHAFSELPPSCRPMPLPVQYENHTNSQNGNRASERDGMTVAMSPLSGTSHKLREMAATISMLGQVFLSGREEDLPNIIPWDKSSSTPGASTSKSELTNPAHSQSIHWSGWMQGNLEFGLELQQPWASALVDGTKNIETRSYKLPPALLGQRLWIIQSPSGTAGVSAMGDVIHFKSVSSCIKDEATIIGWCTFSSVKEYTDQDSFEADKAAHMVSSESGYGWKEGKTDVVYGWVVDQYRKLVDPPSEAIVSAVRRMRSLYELKRTTSNPPSQMRKKSRDKNNRIHGPEKSTIGNESQPLKRRKKRY